MPAASSSARVEILSVPSIGSMLLKHSRAHRAISSGAAFSTLYRVDAIEASPFPRPRPGCVAFSTLYRVDAIEARSGYGQPARGRRLSVPSIGSMLLKRTAARHCSMPAVTFSTLYRVDAIEATVSARAVAARTGLSVPSIGSMLLKPGHDPARAAPGGPFSTLYRVDAIEATTPNTPHSPSALFQYPLSGRCY